MGEGAGGRGEETGVTVGTGAGEVGGDATGVSEPLDGGTQARVISREADAAIRINLPFIALIFSYPADPRHP